MGIQRHRLLQGPLQRFSAVLGTLPDGGQQVLNRGARRRLGQHFSQAVLDFGRDQAGAQKGRHALQRGHHETIHHAAALIQRHPACSAPIVLIQPSWHHDLAPQGHPLFVDHLLESVYPSLTYHRVLSDLTSLRQVLETGPTNLPVPPADRCRPKRLEARPPPGRMPPVLIAPTAGIAPTGGHFLAISLYKHSDSVYLPSGTPFRVLGVSGYTQKYIRTPIWGPSF